MTINIKNFLNDKTKLSKMGEFQSLKQIDGLEMASISADLYKDGRDDLALFYFSKGANYATLTTTNSITFAGGTSTGALTLSSSVDQILSLNSTDDGPVYMSFFRSFDRHAYLGFGGSSDHFNIMNEESSGTITFGTGGSEKMRLTTTGLGIGTTSPTDKLDVAGSVNISDDLIVADELRPYEIRPSGTSGVRLANSQGNIVGTFGPRSTGANASGIRIEDDFNLILGSDNDYSIAYSATRDTLEFVNGVDFAARFINSHKTMMAVDESTKTIGKRLGSIGVENTQPRSSPHLAQYRGH